MAMFSPVGEWVIRNWKQLRAIDEAREETAGELITLTKAACDLLVGSPEEKGIRVYADSRSASAWRERWYDDDVRGFFVKGTDLSPESILDPDKAGPRLVIRWEGDVRKIDLPRIEGFLAKIPEEYEREPIGLTTVRRTNLCARELTELNAENLLDGSAAQRLADALLAAVRHVETALSGGG